MGILSLHSINSSEIISCYYIEELWRLEQERLARISAEERKKAQEEWERQQKLVAELNTAQERKKRQEGKSY